MYEYGVIIRRAARGRAPVWQFWIGSGLVHEAAGFLAVMDFAGARGFEAFAAGNFDEVGVPEVLLKRGVALPPPPPLPRATGAGGELGAKPKPGRAAAPQGRPTAKPAKPTAKSAARKEGKA